MEHVLVGQQDKIEQRSWAAVVGEVSGKVNALVKSQLEENRLKATACTERTEVVEWNMYKFAC